MTKLAPYYLPAACFLLLTVFFLLMPPLRSCVLSHGPKRLDRFDALIMSALTLAYAVCAFTGLGNTASPETFTDMQDRTAELTLDLSGGTVSHLMLFTGVGIGSYDIRYTTDGSDNYELASFKQSHADVLKWHDVDIDYWLTGGTIRISGRGNVWLGEVAALTEDGQLVALTSDDAALCDEQELTPPKLNFMNSSYFDEIYHARTAWEQLNGIPAYEITHPPLGKTIIGLGIALFGMTPFGWRFSGTLFGVLMLPLLYLLAKKLFGGRTVPAACTALMATDFMHFVQSRIATIDVYAVFFILLMYLFMYLFLSEGKLWALALSGVSFGVGAACKWTCFYAGAGLGVLWAIWALESAKSGALDWKGFLKNCGFCVVFFILVPALIYDLAYLPYGLTAGISNPFSRAYIRMVLDNQKYMFSYHSALVSTHPYSSRWYQWLLDIRPILYYLEYFPNGTHASFGAWVNPVLCWGGLFALFVIGYLAAVRRDKVSRFIMIGYLAQLLPWIPITRLTFSYHYFPCTVFLALALGRCFSVMRLNEAKGRIWIAGFVGLSLAVFVLFFPSLAGLPVRSSFLRSWLPTWPF